MQAFEIAFSFRSSMSGFAARMAWITSQPSVWVIWGITRSIMFLNLYNGHHYCDPQFYQYAGYLAEGKLPFINYAVEYPPLAMIIMLIPALPLLPFPGIAPRPELDPHPWSPDPVRYGAYGISFAVMILIVDVLTMLLVRRLAQKWITSDTTGWTSAFSYVVLVFASGALLQKFELLVGTLILLAVLAMGERKEGWAWSLLVMATLIKGYPILLAPLFLIWMVALRPLNWNVVRRTLIGGGVTSLLLIGPFLIFSGIEPLIMSVRYHADRGIEIESIWSTLLIISGWLTRLNPYSYYNPADLSADITSPLSQYLMIFANPIMIGLCIWVFIAFWQRLDVSNERLPYFVRRSEHGKPVLAMCLLHASLVVTMIFLLSFRALGLHYLVAILPMAAVVRLPGKYTRYWIGCLIGGLIMGQLVVATFPQLIDLKLGAELILLARNGLLVASVIVLARAPLLLFWKEVLRRAYYERTSVVVPQVSEPVAPISRVS
jgi:hypothetical protein